MIGLIDNNVFSIISLSMQKLLNDALSCLLLKWLFTQISRCLFLFSCVFYFHHLFFLSFYILFLVSLKSLFDSSDICLSKSNCLECFLPSYFFWILVSDWTSTFNDRTKNIRLDIICVKKQAASSSVCRALVEQIEWK